jgi:hypothetical protein
MPCQAGCEEGAFGKARCSVPIKASHSLTMHPLHAMNGIPIPVDADPRLHRRERKPVFDAYLGARQRIKLGNIFEPPAAACHSGRFAKNLAYPVVGREGHAIDALTAPYIERIDKAPMPSMTEVGEVMKASATTLTELMGLNVYWVAAV